MRSISSAIERVVMRGASTPTGLMIAPGINGFQEDMNEPYAYDPESSKELLAEAGYRRRFPGHARLPERPLRQRRGDLHRGRADAASGSAST